MASDGESNPESPEAPLDQADARDAGPGSSRETEPSRDALDDVAGRESEPAAEGHPDGQEGADATPAVGNPNAVAVFQNVSKAYGEVHALGPIDIAVEGQIVGLLGPNGAGKTTLMRILLGLLEPSAGSVELLGNEVSRGNMLVRQRIGYVPEGESQFPELAGVHAVAYAGRLCGMHSGDAMQRAHQVLDYVGLMDERYRRVETYSTGMRQRLKLAQALVHDPELLILDEPTEGVDPQAREDLLSLIQELATEHGMRVLISTHLLPDVERLATHAIVLNDGLVVASGSIDELRTEGARGYMVRVAGSTEPLIEVLEAAGVAWHPMTPSLRVELDEPREILKHVQEAGVVVRHLAPVQLRLDEAFEQALGGGPPA